MKAKILRTAEVPIDTIKPYAKNARRGDVAVIRESLRVNGMYRPVVVWQKTKEILAGNHTWMARKAEGEATIWATFVQCDAVTAKRINLVDNRAPEHGDYDTEALVALLGELPDLGGTGWSQDDMQKLMDQLPDPQSALEGEVPDDDYESQLGVVVICEDSEQQQKVYDALQTMVGIDRTFAGAELKIVAV